MTGVVCKPGVRANPVLTLLPVVLMAPLHNVQILLTRMHYTQMLGREDGYMDPHYANEDPETLVSCVV